MVRSYSRPRKIIRRRSGQGEAARIGSVEGGVLAENPIPSSPQLKNHALGNRHEPGRGCGTSGQAPHSGTGMTI